MIEKKKECVPSFSQLTIHVQKQAGEGGTGLCHTTSEENSDDQSLVTPAICLVSYEKDFKQLSNTFDLLQIQFLPRPPKNWLIGF